MKCNKCNTTGIFYEKNLVYKAVSPSVNSPKNIAFFQDYLFIEVATEKTTEDY